MICSIATIIERGKARWHIQVPHIFAALGVVCGVDTKALRLNKDMSRDVTPLPVKSSDKLARSTT